MEDGKLLTDSELLKARDDKWIEWGEFEYGQYYPRFYRHGVGGKREFINPWKSMDELRESQAARRMFYDDWTSLNLQCFQRGLPGMSAKLALNWIKIDTPNGERWVRNG